MIKMYSLGFFSWQDRFLNFEILPRFPFFQNGFRNYDPTCVFSFSQRFHDKIKSNSEYEIIQSDLEKMTHTYAHAFQIVIPPSNIGQPIRNQLASQ